MFTCALDNECGHISQNGHYKINELLGRHTHGPLVEKKNKLVNNCSTIESKMILSAVLFLLHISFCGKCLLKSPTHLLDCLFLPASGNTCSDGRQIPAGFDVTRASSHYKVLPTDVKDFLTLHKRCMAVGAKPAMFKTQEKWDFLWDNVMPGIILQLTIT